MNVNIEYRSFESTGFFTQLSNDYIKADPKLLPFFEYPVGMEGIAQAIEARKGFATDRETLVEQLRLQYASFQLSAKQQSNIDALLQEQTFTVCTAHQPVIFTGPLYFIYKILHAIKLADELNEQFPSHRFVPVFYMGSEDADLNELGNTNINGERYSWHTTQTGAVGRMKVDNALLKLMDKMSGQLSVLPHGAALVDKFRQAYTFGTTIQHATLSVVQELFAEYGLLVIIPDNAALKQLFVPMVKRELETQFSHAIAAETIAALSVHYRQQAAGRDINLFYLIDDRRERIEQEGDAFVVKSLQLRWNLAAIVQEAHEHPDRFSANVILRPLFQETILPNIAFIGGGGETAYWLELKALFAAAGVHYPVLILRNSFLLATAAHATSAHKLGFALADLFQPAESLLNHYVQRQSNLQLHLDSEKRSLTEWYEKVGSIAGSIDSTLGIHTKALATQAMKRVTELEKKMLRAEKRKFADAKRQLTHLRQQLFPGNGLQERTENFASFYARYGSDWIQAIYHASQGLAQQFGIVTFGED